VQENDIQYKNDVLQADYVKANGLGGSMVWAMDTSFFRFVNKRAIYRLGLISLAHVTDFPRRKCTC
jgi:GH18 family chitinase